VASSPREVETTESSAASSQTSEDSGRDELGEMRSLDGEYSLRDRIDDALSPDVTDTRQMHELINVARMEVDATRPAKRASLFTAGLCTCSMGFEALTA
jgi:hypothetical protein